MGQELWWEKGHPVALLCFLGIPPSPMQSPSLQPSSVPVSSAKSQSLSVSQGRSPASGLAFEVQPGQAARASAFMQGLVGGSDYAADLGANFSALLTAKYGITTTSKARRAFWVNPAVAWAAADAAGRLRFSLTQRVIVVALVHFVAGGVRRREIVSSGSGAGAGVAAVEFGVGLADSLAAQLGLPANYVSTWQIGLALSAEQACMAARDRDAAASIVLLNYLA
jgi:hypothetical protein